MVLGDWVHTHADIRRRWNANTVGWISCATVQDGLLPICARNERTNKEDLE